MLPELEKHWFDIFGKIATTGESVRLTSEVKSLKRWLDVYACRVGLPENRKVGVVLRDITEQKRAEEALRKSEEWQRLLFESVKDFAIFSMDTSGCIADWNKGAERLFGYSATEMLGSKVEKLFTPEDCLGGLPAQEMSTASREGSALGERWQVRKNGERFYASGTTQSLRDGGGKLLGFVKVARDITERHLTAKQLENDDRRKTNFMAMLAHELRNPLTPIKTAAQILRMAKVDDPTVIRAHEMIEHQANHMARLVDDLLDMSRLKSGKVRLKKEMVSLTALVSEAVESCIDQVRLHSHKITVDLQSEPVPFINADSTRVIQIINNIVLNATKYTPNGGIIKVAAAAEEDFAVVRVQDNGSGIVPQMLTCIHRIYTRIRCRYSTSSDFA